MRRHATVIVLAIALAATSAGSLFVGAVDIDPAALMRGDAESRLFFFASRIPRLLAILCTGAGLSVAGLIMQKLCMNKFVSPTTGATISSAQLGMLLGVILLPNLGFVSQTLLAFAAASAGTCAFVWLVMRIRFKDVVMVPLVGIMFGDIIGGVTQFLAYGFDLTQFMSSWLVGHFSMVVRGNYELVWLVAPLVAIAFAFANHFNIVGMGRDVSRDLGVHYRTILFSGLVIASLITASIVVTVGTISYIGLIIPNLVAMFKGDRIRGTLVDTALAGALFVLVCDIVARTVIAPYELPVNLIAGVVGSVVFVGMLVKRLMGGGRAARPARVEAGRR